MNGFVKFLLVAAGTVGSYLALRAVVAKYAAVATAAVAVWNDPQVKKVRRRAVKKLQKAHKASQKA